MKKIIIILSLVAFISLCIILLRFTIFSNNAAKIYIENFLAKNNISGIKYSKVYFKISVVPSIILEDFSYGNVLKKGKVKLSFPFLFYIDREQKLDKISIKDANFFINPDARLNILSLYDILKPNLIEIENSKFKIDVNDGYVDLNVFIYSVIFDFSGEKYFANINFKDINFKNHIIKFDFNKDIEFYSSFKRVKNSYVPDKKVLKIDGEPQELSISYLDRVLNIIFNYKNQNFLISNFGNKLSLNIKGFNKILGDYEMNLGLISKFLDLKFEFNNNFSGNNADFRGAFKGNISLETMLDSLDNTDINLKINCDNISNKNENFPIQIDGSLFSRNNILYVENLKCGIGKSFFKIGGQITKFNDFVYSMFLSDDFNKSQGVFLFTSQKFDILELSQQLKKILYKGVFFNLLPNSNIEVNIDYNGFSIGDIDFGNGIGSIKFRGKEIKSYLKPIDSNGDYSLSSTWNFSSLDMIKLSNFVFIKNVALKKVLQTYLGYDSNNRAVANVTYNIEILLNSLKNKVDKFFIVGKLNSYSGYISNDRFFNSLTNKLGDDRFKTFNFKYFNFNLNYDYLTKDLKINNFSFSSGDFNIRGNIGKTSNNQLNFIGNMFVIPENYKKWETLPGFNFDSDLKLYVLPLDFEF